MISKEMMKCIETIFRVPAAIALSLLICHSLSAQVKEEKEEPPPVVEEELENAVSQSEEDLEDDEWLQQLVYFRKHPINVNTADAALLMELRMLSPVQIDALLQYRAVFGPLLSVYELQAVPGWHVDVIRKLLPYISVEKSERLMRSFRKLMVNGDNVLLLRLTRVPEKSEGYLRNGSDGRSFYAGSPEKYLLRFKYRYGNELQWGFTAEKDAGEPFLKGAQKAGFDFYSFHFFLRRSGVIQTVALGDFTVNMGQGLVQWQGLSFNGISEILGVKRQSPIWRPYSSAGEFNFHRGAAVTMKLGSVSVSAFASRRKLDAGTDQDGEGERVVTSLRTSGLHRTGNEIAGRGAQAMFAAGGRVGWRRGSFSANINSVHYRFKHPMEKPDELYNVFGPRGKAYANHSFDFGYTYRNVHAFGEMATDANFKGAFIGGIIVSANSQCDVSLLYRSFSPRYQSFFSSAFSRGSGVGNEKGIYAGVNLYPLTGIQVTASADFFSFPWLKYRIDAPSEGARYLFQVLYRPARGTELYSRFQNNMNPLNERDEGDITNAIVTKRKQTWRNQFNYQIDKAVTIRARVEVSWYDKRGPSAAEGFLMLADVYYKPLLKPFSVGVRLSRFDTDDYNSRIYAFESDVRFSYSVPAFYDKGFRYYFNMKYRIKKGLDLYARFAQTMYDEKQDIGTGPDKIAGNKKSELKVQVIYGF